jgi:hypothetical protein
MENMLHYSAQQIQEVLFSTLKGHLVLNLRGKNKKKMSPLEHLLQAMTHGDVHSVWRARTTAYT